jgi:hypothetical protein
LIQVDSLRYTVKPVYKGHSKEPEKSAGALYMQVKYTVKSVYKDHSKEPANVAFVSRCPLYTG